MIPAYSGFLALRYLRTRWVNILGTLGVAVAVWALIVVIAVFSGFISEIRQSIRIATPDLLATGFDAEASFEELDALIRADEDVVGTAPRLRHHGMYFPYGRLGQHLQQTRGMVTSPLAFDFVELVGIDAEREKETTGFRTWIEKGAAHGFAPAVPDDPLEVPVALEEKWRREARQPGTPGPLLKASPGVLVSSRRARASQLDLGQQLSVVTARFVDRGEDTDLVQVRRYFTISGCFETNHQILDETTALVGIDALREMLGQHPDDPFAIDLVSDVAIRVRPGADPATVAARVQAALLAAQPGATVLTWEQQNRVFLGAVDQERGMMKLILFAVMLVAAFLIYSTLHMTVTQKTRDIGVLTSMGAAPPGILRIFVLSGGVIGVAGAVLGVVSGLLSAHYLNDINDWSRAKLGVELFPTALYSLDQIPYEIEPGWVTQVAVSALAITLLAAWLPARRAARMDPVRALSHE
ncbi:MAG: ABC transporter permease [Planctomycetota bacterium]